MKQPAAWPRKDEFALQVPVLFEVTYTSEGFPSPGGGSSPSDRNAELQFSRCSRLRTIIDGQDRRESNVCRAWVLSWL
jgi:hypothetical protein